jgi:hypothetical protein
MAQTAPVLVVHTLGPVSEGNWSISCPSTIALPPAVIPASAADPGGEGAQSGPGHKFKGTAKVGDKVVAEAVFAAMVRENT